MFVVWKAVDTQNNSLKIDLSEEEDEEDEKVGRPLNRLRDEYSRGAYTCHLLA
jgi:hypothetical protein